MYEDCFWVFVLLMGLVLHVLVLPFASRFSAQHTHTHRAINPLFFFFLLLCCGCQTMRFGEACKAVTGSEVSANVNAATQAIDAINNEISELEEVGVSVCGCVLAKNFGVLAPVFVFVLVFVPALFLVLTMCWHVFFFFLEI